MPDEQTPLLQHNDLEDNPHTQYCMLTGVPPSNLPPDAHFHVGSKTLYGRAIRQHGTQQFNYVFTASLSNTLLLSQVVLAAALTALGASESSHVLITIFGVLNTIIAGLVAYLKSRGQPMRSRMYRDDLSRVVDEMENSETMWLGISKGVHGYEEIDIDDKVTVRSEVARLTRLYDRAVRSNTMNNPDMYMASQGGDIAVALRARPEGPGQGALPPAMSSQAMPAAPAQLQVAIPPPAPEDESPVTARPKQVDKESIKDTNKEEAASASKEPAKATPSKDDKPTTDGTLTAHAESAKDDVGKAVPKAEAAPAPGSVAAQPDESPATTDPTPRPEASAQENSIGNDDAPSQNESKSPPEKATPSSDSAPKTK
ncbi:MAG: hypothetical protein Q9160_006355 [Pyrenula sp. 1 TL-2023]